MRLNRTTVTTLLCLSLFIFFLLSVQPLQYTSEGQRARRALDPPQGYVLSLQYADQHSNALYRLLSLQCWAGGLNMSVVEPFVTGTGLGLAKPSGNTNQSPLLLSSVYDLHHWNGKVLQIPNSSHSALVRWSHFLAKAPRKLVLIEVLYHGEREPCTFENFTRWTAYLQGEGFVVTRRTCVRLVPFRPILEEDFNSQLFPDGDHDQVTLLFNNWKGIKHDTRRYHNVGLSNSRCTIGAGYDWAAEPSTAVYDCANWYMREHLPKTGYVSLMLRTEILALHGLGERFDTCLSQTVKAWKAVTSEVNSTNTFITADIGTFGSHSGVSEHMEKQRKDFLASVIKTLTSKTALENSTERYHLLVNHAGTKNPTFISLVDKVIAVRARCFILVGAGRFQKHAAALYRKQHQGENECIIWYNVCQPMWVAPVHLKDKLQ